MLELGCDLGVAKWRFVASDVLGQRVQMVFTVAGAVGKPTSHGLFTRY